MTLAMEAAGPAAAASGGFWRWAREAWFAALVPWLAILLDAMSGEYSSVMTWAPGTFVALCTLGPVLLLASRLPLSPPGRRALAGVLRTGAIAAWAGICVGVALSPFRWWFTPGVLAPAAGMLAGLVWLRRMERRRAVHTLTALPAALVFLGLSVMATFVLLSQTTPASAAAAIVLAGIDAWLVVAGLRRLGRQGRRRVALAGVLVVALAGAALSIPTLRPEIYDYPSSLFDSGLYWLSRSGQLLLSAPVFLLPTAIGAGLAICGLTYWDRGDALDGGARLAPPALLGALALVAAVAAIEAGDRRYFGERLTQLRSPDAATVIAGARGLRFYPLGLMERENAACWALYKIRDAEDAREFRDYTRGAARLEEAYGADAPAVRAAAAEMFGRDPAEEACPAAMDRDYPG